MKRATWRDIRRLVWKLARHAKKFSPQVVIGIAKGGVVPAVWIANILHVQEFDIMRILFYTDIGKHLERPLLLKPITINLAHKRVLIVDDIVDTGKTMKLAIEHVYHCGASEAKFYALYCKPRTLVSPDCYGELTDDWIVFPWEANHAQ